MNKEKFFRTAMVALGCFVGMFVIIVAAMLINSAKVSEQNEKDFFSKCAAACAPNDVYSTKYNRCSCNASVIVKEIPNAPTKNR